MRPYKPERPVVNAYVVVVRGGTLAGHSIRRECLLVAGNDVAVLVDEGEDVGLVEQPVAVVTPQPAAGVGARTVREKTTASSAAVPGYD